MINNLTTLLRNSGATRGFTLIEALVAVLLLALAIAGPLTIASKGLTATLVAKDQFIAFFLAQDAMEQVRFLRDSACLGATSDATGCPASQWLSTLTPCVSTNGSAICNIDSLQGTVCTQGDANCAATINYDSANNFYSYTSGDLSPQRFRRDISITYDQSGTNPDEAIVRVQVSWRSAVGGTRPPIVVQESIFRWQ